MEFLTANYKSWKYHSLAFMLNTPGLIYEAMRFSVHFGWIVILGLRNEWSQPIISTVKINQIIIEFPNLLLLQLADFTKKSVHWIFVLYLSFLHFTFLCPHLKALCHILKSLFILWLSSFKNKPSFPWRWRNVR